MKTSQKCKTFCIYYLKKLSNKPFIPPETLDHRNERPGWPLLHPDLRERAKHGGGGKWTLGTGVSVAGKEGGDHALHAVSRPNPVEVN